jgi:hypothetical protein
MMDTGDIVVGNKAVHGALMPLLTRTDAPIVKAAGS